MQRSPYGLLMQRAFSVNGRAMARECPLYLISAKRAALAFEERAALGPQPAALACQGMRCIEPEARGVPRDSGSLGPS